ncbi:hypothetical protein ACFFMN_28760 [Planobispora siamensis]|nr:hypothetical protein [Planobispora siamensis]
MPDDQVYGDARANATVLAEVLFCSPLQPSDRPTVHEVRQAVEAVWDAYDAPEQMCVAQLAADYGRHPELACARMRWCRGTVAWAYDVPLAAAEAA